jgi:RNA polymerase sigma-70 factor, ECF subfamily
VSDGPRADLTQMLQQVNRHEPGAWDALAAGVYGELHTMAQRQLARGFGARAPGLTIQPTSLVNETFLKLLKQRQQYDNSGHFFAIACQQMRRVLMDYYRQRKAAKRGGGAVRVQLPEDGGPECTEPGIDIVALDDVLAKLQELDSRKAAVVQYRILWNFTNEEIAASLGVSRQTVERDWAFTKVWLAKELGFPK